MAAPADDRRNPYLILGVAPGVDRATAERAFAHRSRVARARPDSPYDAEDLAWAIARVEAHLADPASANGTFRVPAHPEVLDRPRGQGLFRPPVRALPRRSPPTRPEEVEAVADEARRDALEHLLASAAAEARRMFPTGSDGAAVRAAALRAYPRRPRSALPFVLSVAVALIGGLAAYSVIRGTDDDAASSAATSVAATVPPTAAVLATAPPSTEAPPTSPPPAAPSFGEPVERSGIRLTPSAPVDDVGHLCVLFEVDGEGPLGFVPANAALVSGTQLLPPALGVTTGRATNDVVYGELGPVAREVCWAVVGWRQRTTEIVYLLGDDEYRWTIA